VKNVGLKFQYQSTVEKRCTWKVTNLSVGWVLLVDIKMPQSTAEMLWLLENKRERKTVGIIL
jgi:hypothetical protein